jgi:hypothetical protein
MRRPLFGPLYQPLMTDYNECGGAEEMSGRGNLSTLRKRDPVPLCPPKTPTRPDLGSNTSRRCGNMATNRLSYSTAYLQKTETPWSESASELYRPSDRRLSAK